MQDIWGMQKWWWFGFISFKEIMRWQLPIRDMRFYMKIMDLLFQEKVIGYVDTISKEDFWIYGKSTSNESTYNYMNFFRAIICEE